MTAPESPTPLTRSLLLAAVRWWRELLAHPTGETRRLLSFGMIGLASTILYAVLYAVLRRSFGPAASNVIALIPTMALNFWANRSLTFRSNGGPLLRQASTYLVAYLLGLAFSAGIFAVLLALFHPGAVLFETGAGIASGLAATLIRYVLMSRWVFASPRRPHHPHLERQAKTP